MPETSDGLQRAWSAFDRDIASRYLKDYGHPSLLSRSLLREVLAELSGGTMPRLLDLGCGNGQLYEFFRDTGLKCHYTGVDFSEPLLAVAVRRLGPDPNVKLIKGNIETLEEVTGKFDFAIYSHVVELLSCPEASLLSARRLAKRIAIRFYEPPDFEVDRVELRTMEVGGGRSEQYLRRMMSRDFYRLILSNVGCTRVDIYQEPGDKDQIHILNFD